MCGTCCSRLKVPLRSYEYARIFQVFGPKVIRIDSSGKPYLKKVKGNCVFQDPSRLCVLQPLGLKPVACKLWPFAISRREVEGKRNRRAVFRHRGERYYAYINPSCNGINQGNPKQFPSTLHEVVEISLNPSKLQKYSTSQEHLQGTISHIVAPITL